MKKQLIALCLSLFLSTSMMPVSALAEEPEDDAFTVTVDDTTATEDTTDADVTSANIPFDQEIEDIVQEGTPTTHVSDMDIPDNDELLEEYLYQDITANYGISMASLGDSGTLTDLNLAIYNKLKEQIEKIAAGSSDSSVIALDLADLGISNPSYSASELGVSSIAVNGKIAEDAITALCQTLDFDMDLIMDCLLADCPYDLYWYDKTIGLTYIPKCSATNASGEWRLSFASGSGIEVHMAVSSDYIPSSAEFDSNLGGYISIDTQKTKSVKSTIINAKLIVNNYQNESDYDKLTAYRQEICDLVSYNSAAAEDTTTPYGDPWQIIYVFDNDPTTNVVCEGYAKAFKYLCDLSTFYSDDVYCYIVTGTIPSGEHMWNIVTMEDNKNYLVDVTNCDENAIGADDKLFLVTGTGSVSGGYTITVSGQQIRYLYDQYTINAFGSSILTLSSTSYTVHNYVATTTKSATCGETGIITYTCSDGDASYTRTIPATGNHTTSAAKRENVTKATVSKNGSYDSVVYCSICGTELSRKPVTIYKISTITLSSSSYVYNGNAKKPTVTVKNSKGKKIDATYYSVSYKNNKTPGTATVTIKFKPLYDGTLSKTFTIKPKGTSISSTSRKSKGFTVKWKAQKTQTSGYQIQYSTSSKFTTSTTKSALIKISKTSYTATSLKAKKTYYIRIRTYKTVGKKKYYSAWSTVKKVTTK